MKYTVHHAKAKLLRLLEQACSGVEVIIARGKQLVAKLMALDSASKKRVPGRLAEQISHAPDAFEPLTGRELSGLGFE